MHHPPVNDYGFDVPERTFFCVMFFSFPHTREGAQGIREERCECTRVNFLHRNGGQPGRLCFASFVIPAQAGLRRQDAEANIGGTAADGPKGELQEQFVIYPAPADAHLPGGVSGGRLKKLRDRFRQSGHEDKKRGGYNRPASTSRTNPMRPSK